MIYSDATDLNFFLYAVGTQKPQSTTTRVDGSFFFILPLEYDVYILTKALFCGGHPIILFPHEANQSRFGDFCFQKWVEKSILRLICVFAHNTKFNVGVYRRELTCV